MKQLDHTTQGYRREESRIKQGRAWCRIVFGLLLACGTTFAAETLQFSGYAWRVRLAGTGGPGPNEWAPTNAFVDTNGWLHLRLTQQDGKWYCAEVFTRERLGYGRYEFTVQGRVDQLDRNVVLGIFNYPTSDVGPDGTHEIDIEFAQWGNAASPHGNYTVWPATNLWKQAHKAFSMALDGDLSRHCFTWTPSNVVFQSVPGSPGGVRSLGDWRFEPPDPELRISRKPMPVHFNLWCFQGRPPTDGKPVEIIIRSFRFTPL
jgi:hypothetical protein